MNGLSAKPKVVIVGKTNVGKSSIFNLLVDKKISISHNTPGATRDCIIREATFQGKKIDLVDSGGFETKNAKNPFQELVCQRVADFVNDKSDLIVFVVSAKDGLSEEDDAVATLLRETSKPVLMVINKVDNDNIENQSFELQKFGFANVLCLSAAQNKGLVTLKEKILELLAQKEESHVEEMPGFTGHLSLLKDQVDAEPTNKKLALAVVGRPNAGKSTLVNALLNEDRVMTSSTPGTTVDAVDTFLKYAGHDISLVDTAGIRRQRSIDAELEKMAIARSFCAVDRASVCALIICGIEGVTEQDKKIAGLVFEKKKACVIVVNKWDEERRVEKDRAKFLERVRFELPFLNFAPVVFISAKEKRGVFKVLDHGLRLGRRFHQSINTSKVNRTLMRAQEAHPAPVFLGRRLKMYFATQIETAPPTFAVSCSKPKGFHFSYKRYLMNFFRKDLGLEEIPLRLFFREKNAGTQKAKQKS